MPNKREWPSVVDVGTLRENAHIPDSEVAETLVLTEAEIEHMEKVAAAYQVIADHHPDEHERRLAHFRSGAIRVHIDDRTKFVAFLRSLQRARRAHGTAKDKAPAR